MLLILGVTPNAAFTACKNQIVGINNVDSHLIKNSEWGAVGFLAYSKYGSQSNANTTGNETGVKLTDSEIVAAGYCLQYKNASDENINIFNDENVSTKYATKYTDSYGTINSNIKGDGILEAPTGTHYISISSDNPVFVRGNASDIFSAGSLSSTGTAKYRPVIIVEY